MKTLLLHSTVDSFPLQAKNALFYIFRFKKCFYIIKLDLRVSTVSETYADYHIIGIIDQLYNYLFT